MQRIIRFSSLFILAIALSSVAAAQTTSGSIVGTITDPSQAAISNATVKITDESRSFTLSGTTDGEGRFVFPQVPPGTYKLSIEATGFKKLERTGILLVANDRLTLGDIVVQVGATSETVTVVAEATLLQAESAERSYAVQGEVVRNIAVNGRNFAQLASVAAGLVTTSSNGVADDITQISANGLRTSANNLQIDGVATVDTGNNGQLVQVTLDAISEFKVLTSNYQAEYGRSAGAQISAVTKSGTKDFHGSFYAFRRHDGMNANTWINNHTASRDAAGNLRNFTPKPKLDQRDLGYTIGGPVWIPKIFNENKDKVFFFFNQEYQKRLTPPNGPNRVTVPTALERAGDFSQSVDNAGKLFNFIRDPQAAGRCQATPATTDKDFDPTINYQAACFQDGGVLGRIPQGRLFQTGLNILKIYPLPNTSGTGFNFVTEEPTSAPQRQDLVRGDWNINDNWRANGKFLYYKNAPVQPYGSFVLGTNMPDFATLFQNNRYHVSGTVTGSLSPSTVLEVTFGQSHNNIDILPNNPNFNRTDLNLTGLPLLTQQGVQLDLPPQFIFGGGRIANGPNIGSNNAPFFNFNTTRDFAGSVSKIVGAHNFKFGAFWQNSFKPQSSFAANNGQYNFVNDTLNPLDTGFGFANAAIGVFNTFTQASDYIIGEYRYNNVEWYAQDNWKVSNRLTLDYGMRFYWIQQQLDESSQAANFLPDQFDPSKASLLYRPICIGASPCSAPERAADRRAVDPRLLVPGFVPTTSNTIAGVFIGRIVPNTLNLTNGVFRAGDGIEQGLYRNRGVHFAPRLGFAYDMFGDQNLVIRAGAGVFYDRPQGNTVFDLVQNPPTTTQATLFFGQIQSVGTGQALLAPPSLVAIDREGKIPTTYAYNIGVQYKLPFESVLDVSYVGTSGQHLLQRRSLNAPDYGAAYLAKNQDPTQATPGSTTFNGSQALTPDFLRPFQGFGQIQYIEPSASSNYHALQTSLNRRFSRGVLMGVNYTWSKALGVQSADLPNVQNFGAPHNLDNRRANYGPLDFDRRHNFTINGVWQMPKFTQSRALGYALNDWQLSGIFRYVTGQPYNITVNVPGVSAYTLTGTQNVESARIVMLKNPGSGHSSNPYRQFDVTALAQPTPGSTGFESGRNFLYSSPINALDLSLSKRFRFKEKVEMEFRLDAFNALNHTQFDAVNGTFTGPVGAVTPDNLASEFGNQVGFGAVTSVRRPRNLQLVGRIQF
ncbi:MAG TPA: TonB-dependent receptor [Blastocatellia bacterium]|nr:TonB-dependent receptor [Blastocatellia bacterium]